MREPITQLTVTAPLKPPRISAAIRAAVIVPVMVADAGDQAARRYLGFTQH